MNRDLMNLALEALECHGCPWIRHEKEYNAAIEALRAELAKPKPKPIFWARIEDGCIVELSAYYTDTHSIPLYAGEPND